jgi:dihydrofolate reductase
MRISLVVAAARNGVIGRNGGLPWSLPSDLKRFRELTMGKPMLMGRRTWDSLPRRPLPGRPHHVVSLSVAPGEHDGAHWHRSLVDALDACRATGAPELAVIGGAEIFRQILQLADRLYFTHIEQDVEGDIFMPPLDDGWAATSVGPLLHENGLDFRYVDYDRVKYMV